MTQVSRAAGELEIARLREEMSTLKKRSFFHFLFLLDSERIFGVCLVCLFFHRLREEVSTLKKRFFFLFLLENFRCLFSLFVFFHRLREEVSTLKKRFFLFFSISIALKAFRNSWRKFLHCKRDYIGKLASSNEIVTGKLNLLHQIKVALEN